LKVLGKGQGQAAERRILALLFLIGIIAYADRQIIAVLKPELDCQFGWNAADYASISSWSQAAIAVSLLASGWIVDRLGVRATLGVGVAGWSVATILHAAVHTVRGFLAVRVGLGLFEGVGTPATMKAVAANFPAERRGHIVGLLNAAPNIAAMLTPLAVAVLFPVLGWRGTFVGVGLSGVACAVLWFVGPVRRPVDIAGTDIVPAGTPECLSPSMSRMVTAFALAKFLTDPVWWFLLFWLPDILHRRYGLDPVHLGVPLAVAYAMAAGGSLLGGYAPRALGRFGLGREGARRLVMGAAAFCVLPLPLVLTTHGLAIGVALCGLTLGAHQIFAANLFGFATEWLPPGRVGRATGIGAFCGNIGGALALHVVGRFAATTDGLLPVFLYCAVAYVLAWLVLRTLVPHRYLDGDGTRRNPINPALPPVSPHASPAR
jgi:MFS transporter, ACS family, hexuronate transporter